MTNELIEAFDQARSDEEQFALLSAWYQEAEYNEQLFNALIDFAGHYSRLGYIDLAITIYQRLYQINPELNLTRLISQSYNYIYEFDKALDWIQLIPEDKLLKEDQLLKAQMLRETGQPEEAKTVLAKLISEVYDYHLPYFELADIYLEEGDISNSHKYIQPVYEYFLDEGIQREARLKLVQLEVQSEQININQIETYMFNSRLPIKTSIEAYTLASIYYQVNRFEEAIKYAEMAVELDGSNAEARYLLVDLYQLTNKEEELSEEIDWFESSQPEDDATIIELSISASDTNQMNEDIIGRLKGYFSYTHDLEEQYIIIRLVVEFYLNQKQPQKALDFIEANIGDGLIEDDVSYFYAKLYQALGKNEQVRDNYQIAIDNLAPEMELVADYVEFLIDQGDYQTAFDLTKRFNNSQYDTIKLKKLRQQVYNKYQLNNEE